MFNQKTNTIIMQNPRHLKLHGVIIESQKGGFTGYFSEFPEAIAEGETEDEVQSNLFEALKEVISYRRSQPSIKNGESSFELNLEIA